MTSSTYAKSTVVIGAEPSAASIICVFVHGRTQSPQAMIEQVINHLDAPTTRFILPKSDGAAWYNARAIDPLTEESGAELGAALAALTATIEVAKAECPDAVLVLAGFSQGACLSMEYTMRAGAWDGALCLFTGCRVGVASDARPHAQLRNMPVYASCGDQDPWIPVPAFIEMVRTLIESGSRIRTEIFPGRGHCVTATECDALNQMLKNLSNGLPAFGESESA